MTRWVAEWHFWRARFNQCRPPDKAKGYCQEDVRIQQGSDNSQIPANKFHLLCCEQYQQIATDTDIDDHNGSAELDTIDESQSSEVLLNANEEAKKHSFYMLGTFKVSPDHTKLAYAEDTTGNPSSQLKWLAPDIHRAYWATKLVPIANYALLSISPDV